MFDADSVTMFSSINNCKLLSVQLITGQVNLVSVLVSRIRRGLMNRANNLNSTQLYRKQRTTASSCRRLKRLNVMKGEFWVV